MKRKILIPRPAFTLRKLTPEEEAEIDARWEAFPWTKSARPDKKSLPKVKTADELRAQVAPPSPGLPQRSEYKLPPEEEAEIDARWASSTVPHPGYTSVRSSRGIIVGYDKNGDPIRKLRKHLKWYEPRQSPRGLDGRVIMKVKPTNREFAELTIVVQLVIVIILLALAFIPFFGRMF